MAVDTRLGRKVVLKLLPSNLTDDPTCVPLLEQEFVEGETLRERMSQTPMNVSEVLEIALQVAAALQAAHESGIVHRDVKPENIMLRRDGVVKVLDFGLAKLTQQYPANKQMKPWVVSKLQTQAGWIKGTVGYMSPEQTQGEEVDRSDGSLESWSGRARNRLFAK